MEGRLPYDRFPSCRRIIRPNSRGRNMNKGLVVPTLLAFLCAAAFFTVPSIAQAQSACDPGFTLTSGGVAEADLNSDGLTCEVTSLDSVTGGLTLLALDNAPVDPALTTFGCPDGSSGFRPQSFLIMPSADRNGDL